MPDIDRHQYVVKYRKNETVAERVVHQRQIQT
jgi:hypothetical protein